MKFEIINKSPKGPFQEIFLEARHNIIKDFEKPTMKTF